MVFCHTLTWISHGCICVPHSEPPYHLSPHPSPQDHPSAPALSTLPHALNLDWWSISHMLIYMFQCYSLKSSHPHLLPQSPKVCSLHLCLFCCLAYRVIITIFLNSIYMRYYTVLAEKAITPHSSTLAWKIPWMEEPGRLHLTGPQRVKHDWATNTHIHIHTHSDSMAAKESQMLRTHIWIQCEKVRVGWFERIGLKHGHYHM